MPTADYLTLDFETRSRRDIDDGISPYARDPSTQVLCLSIKHNGKDGIIWHPRVGTHAMTEAVEEMPCPEIIHRAIRERWEFHASNSPFETYIWYFQMVLKHGWPNVPSNLWRCTATRAAHAGLPRSLDEYAISLRLGEDNGKDKVGYDLMMKMSKPRKLTKKQRAAGESEWIDDGESHLRLRRYCNRDTHAEYLAALKMPPLSGFEQALFFLDRKINQRGIPVDLELCRKAMDLYNGACKVWERELNILTGGEVDADGNIIKDGEITTGGQCQRMIKYANERGVNISSMAKPLLDEIMEHVPLPDDVRRVFEIRQQLSSASVKKYQAALDCTDADGRAREQMLMHGAVPTGRWAGKGIQPHNTFKAGLIPDYVLDVIMRGDVEAALNDPLINFMEGGLIPALGKYNRAIFRAPDGRVFVISDFAGIEARVLNWLVGNDRVTAMFRDGVDLYIDMAMKIYKCSEAEVRRDKKAGGIMRQVGKQAILGLGYQMAALKFIASVKNATGIVLDLEFAELVVQVFRETNPRITNAWKLIEKAVIAAVSEKRAIGLFGNRLVVKVEGKWLTIRLPSGRKMYYFNPIVQTFETKWGPKVGFAFVNNSRKENTSLCKDGFFRKETYGGELIENIVQAISRDLLAEAMFRVDRQGIMIDFHVHDEIVSEVDAGDDAAADKVHELMKIVPAWAEGCPVDAETHTSPRYMK